MKIRISGSADLVQVWADRFAALGIRGRTYPNREDDGARWYADIDDHLAAQVGENLVRPAKTPRKRAGRTLKTR